MKTPPFYPVPLRAGRGQFSFLRDVIGGRSEADQRPRFRRFLKWRIPIDKALERGRGPLPAVTEAEIDQAIEVYSKRKFDQLTFELLSEAVEVWKRHVRRERAAAGGNGKQAKKATAPSKKAAPSRRKRLAKRKAR